MTLALLTLLVACNKDDVEYTETEVTLSVFGVDQASIGYIDGEFVDGYDVVIEHWITVFTDVHLGEGGDRAAVYAADWTQLDAPLELETLALGEGTHELGLSTVPAADGAVMLTEIDEEIWDEMKLRGYTHYIVGSAEDGEYTFEFPMVNAGYHAACVNGETDAIGLTITQEEVDEQTARGAQIDFHLDHLFFDQLDTEAAEMRFEVFAIWADPATGVIDWDDMSQVNAGALADRDGRPIEDEDERQLSYSSAGINMQDYLRYSVQSMVHMNGQGRCEHGDL